MYLNTYFISRPQLPKPLDQRITFSTWVFEFVDSKFSYFASHTEAIKCTLSEVNNSIKDICQK